MDKILVSRLAGMANSYIFLEKPSDIIPFKGNFPIVDAWRLEDYYQEIQSKEFLEDCSEWVQKAVLAGERMYSIDMGFKEWLSNNNISLDDFKKMKSSDKATELVRYFNSRCLNLNALQIKNE